MNNSGELFCKKKHLPILTKVYACLLVALGRGSGKDLCFSRVISFWISAILTKARVASTGIMVGYWIM